MLLGGLFTLMGQSPIVGYLLAGVVLGGPGSLGLIKSEHEIETIAELGVSLLLFSLGLEFSWQRLKAFGSRVLISGVIQVITTMLVAAAAAVLAGVNTPTAVSLGAMVTVSSTACVLRVLGDRGELDSSHGRNSLAILLTQDLAIVPLAILLTILGRNAGMQEALQEVVKVLLQASLLIAALYLIVNKIAVRFLSAFSVSRNRELAILLSVTLGLGSAWGAHYIGISPALGAFICGMFLGSSPFSLQIRSDIDSLRIILLTLFFGSAGMVADPYWMLQNLPLVVGASILLIVVKAAIVAVILTRMGQPLSVATASGISLGQIGEFALVLGGIARESGLISADLNLFVISCAIVTLFLTPYAIALAPGTGRAVANLFGTPTSAPDSGGSSSSIVTEVLVIGFGPAGQIAASALSSLGDRLLVIDLNREAEGTAREAGFRFSLADATHEEPLLHAHLDPAATVLVTIPNGESSSRVVRNLRRLFPKVKIIARARLSREVNTLISAGADHVIDEERQMGIELSAQVERLIAKNLLQQI